MTPLDWAIAAVLLLSLLQGLRRGLIVTILSLLGFIVGLFVATRYWALALPLVHLFTGTSWIGELICFFLVASLVALVFTLVGVLLRRSVQAVGLGWLDRLLGAAFGLLRGALVVVLGFIIVAAFLPTATWTRGSRFAPFFLSQAQRLSRGAPLAAERKVVSGLQQLANRAEGWQ